MNDIFYQQWLEINIKTKILKFEAEKHSLFKFQQLVRQI